MGFGEKRCLHKIISVFIDLYKEFKSNFKNYLALFCVGSSIHLILSRSEFFASYLLWAHLNDGSEKCHMPHNGLERVFFTTALHNYRRRGNLLKLNYCKTVFFFPRPFICQRRFSNEKIGN